jgi:chromosome segregation and condensation protein ScpB
MTSQDMMSGSGDVSLNISTQAVDLSGDEIRDDEALSKEAFQNTSKPEELDLRLEFLVEAIVFASKEPLKVHEIREIMGDPSVSDDDVQAVLDDLLEQYEARKGGFKLVPVKRLGYQFQTSPQAASVMERMFASRPRPITRAALETLAIIAYRQPVTRA